MTNFGRQSPPIQLTFYFSVPEDRSPLTDEVSSETTRWAEHLHLAEPALRDEIIRSDVGDWAGRALPRSETRIIRLPSDLLFWFFPFDDEYCEKGIFGEDPGRLAGALSWLIRVAEHPESPIETDNPLANGLRDIVTRIAALATLRFTTDFVDTLRNAFFAAVWEASFQQRQEQPTLEEYLLMRCHSGLIHPFIMLMELGGSGELTTQERDCRPIRALVEMSGLIQNFDNDILSYHKESREPYSLNAITVLCHQEQLAFPEAIERVLALRNCVMSRYLDVQDSVRDHASRPVADFLDNIDSMVRATFDWQYHAFRYRRPDTAIHATATTARPQASLEPLPFAAVSWWWDPALTIFGAPPPLDLIPQRSPWQVCTAGPRCRSPTRSTCPAPTWKQPRTPTVAGDTATETTATS